MTRARVLAATFAVALAAAPAAFGIASPGNQGNAGDAPGQDNAASNCAENIGKQTENGVAAGGGPKEDVPGPTNCDHFFPPPGQVP